MKMEEEMTEDMAMKDGESKIMLEKFNAILEAECQNYYIRNKIPFE